VIGCETAGKRTRFGKLQKEIGDKRRGGRRLWWKRSDEVGTLGMGHDGILKELIPSARWKRKQQNGDGTKVRDELLHYT